MYFNLLKSLEQQYTGAPGQQTQGLINQYLTGLGQPGGLPFGGAGALAGAQGAAKDYSQFGNLFGVSDPMALQHMGQAYPTALARSGDVTARQLSQIGKQTANQAFDPQSALYNQQKQVALQQATAAEAAGGLQGTPYGATSTADAVNQFNLNWQNNLLQRQIAGGQAASGELAGAQQAKAAGLTGAEQLRQAAFSGAQNLAQTSDQALASTSALPLQTGSQLASNAVQAEAARMAMPAQVLGGLESYLGLGQSAALNSGALGNLGFNQQAGGLAGLIGGTNAILGPYGLLSSGGAGPLSGLFGGAAGGGADFVGGAGADLGGLAPFSLGPSIGGASGVGGSALSAAGLAGAAPFLGT